MMPLLKLSGVSKAFAGIPALRGVDFTLLPGEVHALAGENGAGKSTFIKIIGGAYQADAGEISVSGRTLAALTPADARAAGIAVVYQEFNLLPEMSVAENMFLGDLPRGRFGGYSPRAAEAKARQILERLGTNLDPSRQVASLTVAEQQMVEIGAALAQDAKIIIMDEPSTVLANDELANLHAVVNRLRDEGRGIIYISHRLDEVLSLSDRVTVFKDGQHVATKASAELDEEALIRLMIGRDLKDYFPRREPALGDALLEVEALEVPGKIFDISFSLARGEIIGLAGLGGSGKTTLCRALLGLETRRARTLNLKGQPLPAAPGAAIRNGVVLVPEDRKAQSIFAGHPVAFNITLTALSRLKTAGLLSPRAESAHVNQVIADYDVRPNQPQRDIAKLSGGNQQKVIIGRWFSDNPDLVILDEPTRGVDVGAKSEIYRHAVNFTKTGGAVIIASSDVTELLGLSDRIFVFHEGRIAACLSREEATEERIIRAATLPPETKATAG
jgi:ABC-type sugar transport system ATPase subunit